MGCFVFALLALAVLLATGQALGPEGLGPGFVVGAIIGLLIVVGGGWSHGWNSHVDAVEQRDTARAHDAAERDRR
jgi:hypothetical protein